MGMRLTYLCSLPADSCLGGVGYVVRLVWGVSVVPDKLLPVDVRDVRRPLVAVHQRHREVVKVLAAPVVVLGVALPALDGLA